MKRPLTHRALALAAVAGLGLAVPAIGGTAEAMVPDTSQTSTTQSAPTPTNLRALDSTSTSIDVGWDAPSGATRFRLDVADNPQMTDFKRKWTSRDHLTLGGLPAGSTRFVRVRTVEMNGTTSRSPLSDVVQVATTGATASGGSTSGGTTSGGTGSTTDGATSGGSQAPAPSGHTRFGANYTTAAQVDEGIYAGRATAARIFFQQLDGAKFSSNGAVKQALADGVKTFVISWKETDQNAIKTFLAGIPDGLTVYTSFNHEPEDDHGSPGSADYKAWSTEYKHQWSVQAPLMRAEGFIPTNILMAWTLNPKSGRTVADWTPPKGTVDVFAFDAYYGKGKSPSALVDRITAATKAAGLSRTGLGETGAPASDPDRVANTKEMKTAVNDSGMFDFGLYWNSSEGSGYDSRMDKATADAWFD
jgi:hypothetical protein